MFVGTNNSVTTKVIILEVKNAFCVEYAFSPTNIVKNIAITKNPPNHMSVTVFALVNILKMLVGGVIVQRDIIRYALAYL